MLNRLSLAILLFSFGLHAWPESPDIIINRSKVPVQNKKQTWAKTGDEYSLKEAWSKRKNTLYAKGWEIVEAFEPHVKAAGPDAETYALLAGVVLGERNQFLASKEFLEPFMERITAKHKDTSSEAVFAAGFYLAKAYFGLGESQKGLELLEDLQTIVKPPEQPQESMFFDYVKYCRSVFYSQIGGLLIDYGHPARAIPYIQKAKGGIWQTYRLHGAYETDLAYCHGALGNHAEAEKHYMAAIGQRPKKYDIAYFSFRAAEHALADDRPADALKHLNLSIATHPKYISAYNLAAECAINVGNFPAARQALETSEALGGATRELQRIHGLFGEKAPKPFHAYPSQGLKVLKAEDGSVLYRADFASGLSDHGWKGELTKEGYLKAAIMPNNRYFGAKAESPNKRDTGLFVVGSNTVIRMCVLKEDSTRIVLQGKNIDKKDNFFIRIDSFIDRYLQDDTKWFDEPSLPRGWAVITVPINLMGDNSHTGLVPEKGDRFRNIYFMAGESGSQPDFRVKWFEVVELDSKSTEKTSPADRWKDMPLLLWIGNRGPAKGPALYDKIREFGFTGVFLSGHASADEYQKAGLTFISDNIIRGELLRPERTAWAHKNEWIIKHGNNPAYLSKSESLFSPLANQWARADIRRFLFDHENKGALAYSIGDEMSCGVMLQPGDVNADARWRAEHTEWVRKEYETVSRVNDEWGTRHASLETAESESTYSIMAKVKRNGFYANNYAAWMSRMEFNDIAWAAKMREFAGHVKEFSSDVPVGFAGAQCMSPFGGYNWPLLLGIFDWIEPYDNVGNREMVYGMHQGKDRPFFAVTRGLTFESEKFVRRNIRDNYAHWARGANALIFWDIANFYPGKDVNTPYPGVERFAESVKKIRKASRETLTRRRVFSPIAIIYNQPSVRLNWLKQYHDERNWERMGSKYQREWLVNSRYTFELAHNLRDMGYAPYFITSQQIEKGELLTRKVKVLCAVGIEAVSPKMYAQIKKYHGAGGDLIMQGAFGNFDYTGKPYKTKPVQFLPTDQQVIIDAVQRIPVRGADRAAQVQAALAKAAAIPGFRDFSGRYVMHHTPGDKGRILSFETLEKDYNWKKDPTKEIVPEVLAELEKFVKKAVDPIYTIGPEHRDFYRVYLYKKPEAAKPDFFILSPIENWLAKIQQTGKHYHFNESPYPYKDKEIIVKFPGIDYKLQPSEGTALKREDKSWALSWPAWGLVK